MNRNTAVVFAITLVLALSVVACGADRAATPSPLVTPLPTTIVPSTIPSTAIATSVWEALLSAAPSAYDFPLAEPIQSSIDGIYGKVDQSAPQWWACFRCADYRPAGGIWKLQFDRGVARIYYEITNWKSIASFTISANRLQIFNDPICPHELGEYEWKLENGSLRLGLIQDSCAFELRGKNLTTQSWLACNAEGQETSACQEIPTAPPGQTPWQSSVTVTEYGGDSYYFAIPPDKFAAPNSANVPSPEGVQIAYHDDSIGYGTYRILWWSGDWIEATTELPFTSIGVQFWEARQGGWARILFDGTEVWRGLTSALGSKNQYYGGYIEISDFKPGKHTLRVEGLGFDYHPVTVAAFGFGHHVVQK